MKKDYDSSWDLEESEGGNLPSDEDASTRFMLNGKKDNGNRGCEIILSFHFQSSEWRMTTMHISQT